MRFEHVWVMINAIANILSIYSAYVGSVLVMSCIYLGSTGPFPFRLCATYHVVFASFECLPWQTLDGPKSANTGTE